MKYYTRVSLTTNVNYRILSATSHGNVLVLQHVPRYQQRFYCDFDFRWFPFDSQTCGIQILNHDTLKVAVILVSLQIETVFISLFSGCLIDCRPALLQYSK